MKLLIGLMNLKKLPFSKRSKIINVEYTAHIAPEEEIFDLYYKVKSWKKSPKNYYVWQEDNGEYTLSKSSSPDGISKLIGNLDVLFKKYFNEYK